MGLTRMSRLGVQSRRYLSDFKYVQGQYNEVTNVREYFYHVDHNGQLFLDDARMKNFTSCFKEQKFLRFFFNRVRRTAPTPSGLHKIFRYTSHCGPEMNYIRVDSTPFVFTKLEDNNLEFNFTGLTRELVPESLYVGSDGRVYHEFKHKHVGFALVRDRVADLISLNFVYERDHPVAYRYDGKVVQLDYRLRGDVEEAITT